jgi:hypothetical protein
MALFPFLGFKCFDGAPHGTSSHVVLGYSALKHPCFGRGVFTMVLRQASRTWAFTTGWGCVIVSIGRGLVSVGSGAGLVGVCAINMGEIAQNNKSPDSRLA